MSMDDLAEGEDRAILSRGGYQIAKVTGPCRFEHKSTDNPIVSTLIVMVGDREVARFQDAFFYDSVAQQYADERKKERERQRDQGSGIKLHFNKDIGEYT